MRLLIDTHAVLWWLLDAGRLSRTARAFMGDPATRLYVSVVSGFEIETKRRLKQLDTGDWDPSTMPRWLESEGFLSLDLALEPALLAGRLPAHHNDPFDRLIIAQAMHEGIPVLTSDRAFHKYDVEVIW